MEYRCGSGVSWVVEQVGVRLRNSETGDVHFVAEPDAAIWDLFTRGYSVNKIAELLSWIAGLDAESSERRVAECLHDWTHSGYLTCVNRDG